MRCRARSSASTSWRRVSASASRPSPISSGCCAACASSVHGGTAGSSTTRSTISTSSACSHRGSSTSKSGRTSRGCGGGADVAACTVCELHAESTFRIEGMDCREEVALIERRFKNLPGLEDFSADLIGQRLHVKYDAAKLSASAIAGAVADAGMRAWLEHEEPLTVPDAGARRRLMIVGASGLALLAGLGLHAAAAAPWLERSVFAVAIAAGASLTIRRAVAALRVRALDIHVLMLVAAAGAVALGQWSEAASVVFLFALAQTLEART